MLKKTANFFLILLFLIFILASVYLLVIYNLWPWWMTIFISCGIFFLIFSIIFIKKYLIRKKEKKFVSKIVSTESPSELTGILKKKYENEITKKWMNALLTLKKSNLKRKGNPVYVLPWYMVISLTA